MIKLLYVIVPAPEIIGDFIHGKEILEIEPNVEFRTYWQPKKSSLETCYG